MNVFTAATMKRLVGLGLPPEKFDELLAILEEAREAKAQKKGGAADRAKRGTRLADDWKLPGEWGQWAIERGLLNTEVDRQAERFKDYWLARAGAGGIKLDWFATWRTWIDREAERLGRSPRPPAGSPAQAGEFSRETWEAILKAYKRTNNWSPDHGPAPGRLKCRAPVDLIQKILRP